MLLWLLYSPAQIQVARATRNFFLGQKGICSSSCEAVLLLFVYTVFCPFMLFLKSLGKPKPNSGLSRHRCHKHLCRLGSWQHRRKGASWPGQHNPCSALGWHKCLTSAQPDLYIQQGIRSQTPCDYWFPWINKSAGPTNPEASVRRLRKAFWGSGRLSVTGRHFLLLLGGHVKPSSVGWHLWKGGHHCTKLNTYVTFIEGAWYQIWLYNWSFTKEYKVEILKVTLIEAALF